jgi:hypothetical protein
MLSTLSISIGRRGPIVEGLVQSRQLGSFPMASVKEMSQVEEQRGPQEVCLGRSVS